MVQRLIYDPQVSAAVQRHAEQEGLPTATVIHVMNHCDNMDYVLVTYLRRIILLLHTQLHTRWANGRMCGS